MKFTGVSLIFMGVMLLLLCLVQTTRAVPVPGELAWAHTLSPILTLVVAAGSLVSGVLIILYGGKGYDRSRRTAPAADGTPPAG